MTNIPTLHPRLATGLLCLLPFLAASAGDLDARLKSLRDEHRRSGSRIMAELAAGRPMAGLEAAQVKGNEVILPVLMRVKDTTALQQLGIPFTLLTGDIVSARVSLSSLDALEAARSIKHVRLAHLEEPHNDLNNTKMGLNVSYTAGYTGKNVLVGIVDSGIDVTHPAFRVGGVAGGASRVKYLWDQTASHTPFSVGTFSSQRGRRWTDQEITAGQCTQVDTSGHGTHVAGSAAGYDASFATWNGGAKDANILFVKTSFNTTDILEGVKWMLEEAKVLGKPLVVNMSLGSKFGTHDGNELENKAMDELIEQSNGQLIVVRSAGNYADDGHHDSGTVTTTGISLPLKVANYTPSSSKTESGRVIFYHDATSTVSVRIKDPSGAATEWMTASQYMQPQTLANGSRFSVYVSPDPDPESPTVREVYMELGEVSAADGKDLRPGVYQVEFKSNQGTPRIDGWIYNTSNGALPVAFETPDQEVTLGGGACSRKSIVVAAYVSRKWWDASDGKRYNYSSYVQDQITPFSSKGPTRDGRQKPDVTHGGSMILSARSAQAGTQDAPVLPPTGSSHYMYMQGTSMSSPATAGAVALLKEANPTWTYADVLAYFRQHSQGTPVHLTPGTWDKSWGWGVVNLAQMIPSLTLSVSPEAAVEVLPGGTQSFKATVTGATDNRVNWTVSANGGSIAPATTAGDGVAAAVYTAPAAIGTYTVTAASQENPAKTVQRTVNVLDRSQLALTVSPTTTTLVSGATRAFTATLTGAPSQGTFTWQVNGGTIQASGATGTFTAPTTPGTVTLTVTSSWGVTGNAMIQVKTLDLNEDGAIDPLDLLSLARVWGSVTAGDLAKADLNGDGKIDDADLTTLLAAL